MAEPLGVSKDRFLRSVRQALQKGDAALTRPEPPHRRSSETLAELEAQAAEVRQRATNRRLALLDQFATVAQLRGWRVCRASQPEEALRYIRSVAVAGGIRKVVRSDQDVFKGLPLDSALKELGLDMTIVARDETHQIPDAPLSQARVRGDFRTQMADAGLGITGADYAVAETGSVVVVPRKGLSRLVSVLPPVHLALVRPQEVVETLDDVLLLRRLEYFRNGGDMGSYLNFITGPSRTADIEQTLVVGVHGPREAHLVLLG